MYMDKSEGLHIGSLSILKQKKYNERNKKKLLETSIFCHKSNKCNEKKITYTR